MVLRQGRRVIQDYVLFNILPSSLGLNTQRQRDSNDLLPDQGHEQVQEDSKDREGLDNCGWSDEGHTKACDCIRRGPPCLPSDDFGSVIAGRVKVA